MCIAITAPLVLAGISVALSAAGTGLAVQGNIQAADAAEENAEYEAKIALYNGIAAKNAGETESLKQGIRHRKEFAAQRTRAFAGGLDASFGSRARILIETRKFHAFDGVLLARNTQARVLGAKLSADAATYNGKVRSDNFTFGAIAAGVSGAGQIASSLYEFSTAGINTADAVTVVEPDTAPSARRHQNYGGIPDALDASFNPFTVT